MLNDETVSVIVIANGVVDNATLFTGQKDKISAAAESFFLATCSERITNWDEHDHNDIASILEDGYYQNVAQDWSICLVWPETKTVLLYGVGWWLDYQELCQLAGVDLGQDRTNEALADAFNAVNNKRMKVVGIGSCWEITDMGSCI